MSDEKTEEPTDKKLEDAREKGQSHQSQDINAAANLVTATLCLALAAGMSVDHLGALVALAVQNGAAARDDTDMNAIAFEMARHGLSIVLPFLVASVTIAVVTGFLQVGLVVSFEPVAFKFEKVDPVAGLKKLFSLRSLIDFGKMLVKACVLGAVVFVITRSLLPLLIGSAMQSPHGMALLAWSALLKLCGAAALVFVVIGPVDHALQRWLFVRDQRMSKDEVKREHKDAEGDPQIKSARRQLAREMANSNPKARVPDASVVITNPTHYAVAIKYLPGVTPLPVVLAKGADAEAMLIRAIAGEHRIPIVGNPPLARALFKVPLDEAVPEELFEAVAAVLRWVGTVGHLSGTLSHGLGHSMTSPEDTA